jgi:tRNA/tmRNA/rRNA uracil-C5-methylase (TrmA/RlmC/RlmD family)
MFFQGNNEQAEAYYQEAIDTARQLGQHKRISALLSDEGNRVQA